jgi:hypothetical protein
LPRTAKEVVGAGVGTCLLPLLPNEGLSPWVRRSPSPADDGVFRLPLGLAFVGSDCGAQFGGFLHLSFRSECPNRFIGDPVSTLSQSGGEREQNPSQFVLIANVWPRRPAGLFSTARLRPRPRVAPRVGNPHRRGRSRRATSVSFSCQFARALHRSANRSTAARTETVTLLWTTHGTNLPAVRHRRTVLDYEVPLERLADATCGYR